MRIGIDLDECLAEFVFGFLNYHNEKYGTMFENNDLKTYGFSDLIGGAREEVINKLHDFYETNYFKDLPVVFGSENAIGELVKTNKLFVITARPDIIIGETKKWLQDHFYEKFSDVVFTNEWEKEGRKTRKSGICEYLKLDFMIDDNFEHVIDCAKKVRAVFLFDKPWNQNGKLSDNVTRVYNWNEILEEMDSEYGKH